MASATFTRRDLARLPEPRALFVTPLWLRRFIAVFAVVAAVLGAGMVLRGMQADGVNVFGVLSGLVLFVPAVWFAIAAPLADWRAWIQLAATPDGLFVAGRDGSAVFLPWREVTAITVETAYGRGGTQTHAKLRLRLDAAAAALLGPLQGVEGEGPERTYRPPILGLSGAELAEQLMAWRAGTA